MEVTDIVAELIRRGNLDNPGDTARAAQYVADLLDSDDETDVRLFEHGSNVSVVARKGPRQPSLALNGHLDVVGATADDWTSPPFEPTERDGHLYGRGAYDMKGGLAGLIQAFRQYEPDSVGLTLMAVADEESGGLNGTRFLLNKDIVKPDAVLIGEPTAPGRAIVGRKGRIRATLTASGEAAHGSEYPHSGESAVEALANGIMTTVPRLRMFAIDDAGWSESIREATLNSEAGEGGHDRATMEKLLDDVTVNVGTIHGGTAPNVVADQARAELDLRYPPGVDSDEVIDLLRRRINDNADLTLTIEQNKPPALAEPDSPIVEAVETTGAEPIYSYASDDMAHFHAHDIPALSYGPCRGDGLHGVDERIHLGDLQQLSDQFMAVIDEYSSIRS